MLTKRASMLLLRTVAQVAPRRNLAIASTVKEASDTSEMDFPAPSSVSISTQAADLTRQIAQFYSSPDSVVTLSDESLARMKDEIERTVNTLTDPDNPDDTSAMTGVSSEMRIGDNPIFKSTQQSHEAKSK